MDSAAEEHVVSLADWRRLGEPLLKPAQVRLRSATGDNMGVSGSFVYSFGGNSCYQIFVFSHETCECWLHHQDETNSVCLESQWMRQHTASKMRQA